MNIDEALEERVLSKTLKGYCCSQTITELALEDMGRENEELVQAMAAFCGGMGKGKICGALAAAVAVLHVNDDVKAISYQQEEYMDWFLDRFGGYDCEEIIHGDPKKKAEICPGIVLECYAKLQEFLTL